MSRKLQILIIVCVVSVGVVRYYFIENDWPFLGALYMTIITITTVWFGEVKPLSVDGRIYTIFFIVLGLSTAAVLAGQIAESFLENNFIAIIEENKMRKKMSV